MSLTFKYKNVSQLHFTLNQILGWGMRLGVLMTLQACAVVAVADAAVTVVATGVKVTAKAVGAVAEAVIPGDDDE